MKRKTTELEENLIQKGWELDHKTYTGAHSEKVYQYVYEKVFVKEFERPDGKVVVSTNVGRVYLDSHREKVENIQINAKGNWFDNISLAYWLSKINYIQKEVDECLPKQNNEELSTEEVVEVAEAVNDNE